MPEYPRGAKVARTCKTCKDPFLARVADVNRGWAKFCSKSCKAIEQEGRTHQHAKHKQFLNKEMDSQQLHEWANANASLGWDAHKDF